VTQKGIGEKEPRQLSDGLQAAAADQPKSPKLSLKFLHVLIEELWEENRRLAVRVEELERRLEQFSKLTAEAAASAEQTVMAEDRMAKGSEASFSIVVPQPIRTSRSERHPVVKRRSIWAVVRAYLF
jgi:hypothetical protein